MASFISSLNLLISGIASLQSGGLPLLFLIRHISQQQILRPCLSENMFISLSLLEDIFTEYRIFS